MQKARLTKLNYQQTDGTEKHKKDKTNTVWTKLQMDNFFKTKIEDSNTIRTKRQMEKNKKGEPLAYVENS